MQEACSLSFWVLGYDICLFAVISITPAWTRQDRMVEIEAKAEEKEKDIKKEGGEQIR